MRSSLDAAASIELSKRAWLPRPLRLARYIAASASCRSVSGWRWRRAATATPRLVAGELQRAGERGGDALRHRTRRARGRDVLEQDDELVAAEAGQRVARTQRLPEARGDRDEHLVADLVTQGVVDELEAIDVEEEDGRTPPALAPRLQRGAEPVEEQRAVRKPGQRVVRGAVPDLLLTAPSLDRGADDVRHGLLEARVLGERSLLTHVAADHAERLVRAGNADAEPAHSALPGHEVG